MFVKYVLNIFRSQAKAAVAYNYNKKGRDSDDADADVSTYHGDEEEDKAFSSESEYGEN